MFRLVELIRRNEQDLTRLIARENGKSLPDARAEVKRATENAEVACGTTVLQQGDKLVGGAKDIDGEVLRLPLGVFGMIAPFNFPMMVPFWFFPYALACGNTYVVKPSEQTPLSMTRVAELIDEAGFPPGVFNLVHGDRRAAEPLVTHPDVQGVSFVGTSRVCRMIAAWSSETNKRFQALGSAKNHLVAMPDAKMDDMIRNMVTSCYGCAGQRCMASSAIVAVGDAMYQEVTDRFVEASQQILVADPLDPAVADEPMVMGPVISAKARQFIVDMIETGIEEGATLALDGREMTVQGCENGHFIGPTVFRDVTTGHEDPPDRDLRSRGGHPEGRLVGRGHPHHQSAPLRQWSVDLYAERVFRPQVQIGGAGGHGRHQRRHPGTGGLATLRRHARVILCRYQGAG